MLFLCGLITRYFGTYNVALPSSEICLKQVLLRIINVIDYHRLIDCYLVLPVINNQYFCEFNIIVFDYRYRRQAAIDIVNDT